MTISTLEGVTQSILDYLELRLKSAADKLRAEHIKAVTEMINREVTRGLQKLTTRQFEGVDGDKIVIQFSWEAPIEWITPKEPDV